MAKFPHRRSEVGARRFAEDVRNDLIHRGAVGAHMQSHEVLATHGLICHNTKKGSYEDRARFNPWQALPQPNDRGPNVMQQWANAQTDRQAMVCACKQPRPISLEGGRRWEHVDF